jgi:DNA polymerase elongation subunit (family B)
MDKYYSSLMIIAKKKYSGVVVYESGDCCYLYTRGLESVRSDWPEAVKTFQMKLLMLMLTKKNWRKYIKDTKEAFMRGEFDEKMVIAKTLKRKIDEYQGLPPHIRVAELLVGMGKPPRVGDKIQYIKFGDNPEDVIPVIPGTPVILTQKQRSFLWIKQFEAIISRFSVSKNKTLSDFFGE